MSALVTGNDQSGFELRFGAYMKMQRVLGWLIILIGVLIVLLAWLLPCMNTPNSAAFTVISILTMLCGAAMVISNWKTQSILAGFVSNNNYTTPSPVYSNAGGIAGQNNTMSADNNSGLNGLNGSAAFYPSLIPPSQQPQVPLQQRNR
jgi:glucan phosphoethanolaminetransferase (alkaline phosphatase superfamily)